MSAPKLYRVTVIEWLSHKALIEAEGPEQAEAKARQLWADNAEHEVFGFDDSGIEGIVVQRDALIFPHRTAGPVAPSPLPHRGQGQGSTCAPAPR